MGAVKILPKHLVAGMIIAEDIFSSSNEKIVAKNTIVNPKIISKLTLFSNQEISVLIPKALADRMTAEDPKLANANKLRNTLEFKKFKRNYLNSIDALRSAFESFIQNPNKGIKQEEAMAAIDELIRESGNSMHTFDMLHAMRDYDDLTYVHSMNVALICHAIGNWIGFPEEKTRLLTLAGLFHDIGKAKIPSEILNKPSALTDEEYVIMKKHPVLGYQLVANTQLDNSIKEAVLSHHERYNGTGYPRGLTGAQIGEFASIVAIADVYDAMTSNRSYRERICPFDVVAELESDGYEKFDSAVLLPFLKHIVQSYINAPVLLSNSLVGEVIMINPDHLSMPIVKVDNQFFDLSRQRDIKIRNLL